MRVVALKDLTYSPNGIEIAAVAAGVEFECPVGIARDYAAVGLVAAAERFDFKTGLEDLQITKPGDLIEVEETGPATGDNPNAGDDNPDGADGKPEGENVNPDAGNDKAPEPDPVAAAKADSMQGEIEEVTVQATALSPEAIAKAAEADAAPKAPKGGRKPKAG